MCKFESRAARYGGSFTAWTKEVTRRGKSSNSGRLFLIVKVTTSIWLLSGTSCDSMVGHWLLPINFSIFILLIFLHYVFNSDLNKYSVGDKFTPLYIQWMSPLYRKKVLCEIFLSIKVLYGYYGNWTSSTPLAVAELNNYYVQSLTNNKLHRFKHGKKKWNVLGRVRGMLRASFLLWR